MSKNDAAQKKKKKPPLPVQTTQFDLFHNFLGKDKANSVEVWESIPKYFFTPAMVARLRTKDGHADPHERAFKYDGMDCSVIIHPAQIKVKGKWLSFFPGVGEELVEEALKKILTDQRNGIHNPKDKLTWVSFTLGQIEKELKARGRTRSKLEIKHSIQVMSRCMITLYRGDECDEWEGGILENLWKVSRDKYLADNDAHHVASLPDFITNAINSLEYRQFSFDRLLSCDTQLSRWIYKQLIHSFTYAEYGKTNYHFMYSDLARDSGLLNQVRPNDNRRKVGAALDELVKRGVLANWKPDEHYKGRKITDVKYTVYPSRVFVAEQMAASKRITNNDRDLEISQKSVDK